MQSRDDEQLSLTFDGADRGGADELYHLDGLSRAGRPEEGGTET